MKVKIIAIIAMAFMFTAFQNTEVENLGKKKNKTEIFEVKGNCDMCKTRIENAALLKGVKKATWDKYKKQMTVIYNPKKVKLEDIKKSIAKAGYDNGKYKAEDKDYKKLPSCCAYRENPSTH